MKEKIAMYFSALIFVLTGGFIGFFAAKVMEKADNRFIVLGVLLAFVLVVFAGIIIHEAGHLIFGLLTGYKFLSFRILNIMLIRLDGKYMIKKFSLAGTAGQCLLTPPDLKDGRIPYVWYNLGGVIMNIFTAIVAGIIRVNIQSTFLSNCLLIFMAISIAMAITNGVPLNSSQVANDGYNAMSLGKNPAALRAFWLQLKVNAEIAKGIKLNDMPAKWFRLPSDEEMNNNLIAAEGVLYCNYIMAMQEFEAAEDTIKTLLSKKTAIAGIHKGLLICDEIFCMILRGEEKDKIDKLLNDEQRKFMKSMPKFPSIIRTWYAYNKCVLEDENEAKKNYAEFEKISRTYPYKSDIDSERILMGLL